MKKLTFPFLIIILGVLVFSQCGTKEKKMPITTTSETARTLYNESWTATENFKRAEARKLLLDAIKEDLDFFMANYRLAFIDRTNENNKFKEYGEIAISCKAKLSDGELLLKDAISKLLDNPNADVTDIGKKLIKMYPSDKIAYYQLYSFQGITKDLEGQITTLKSTLEITDNPAIIYNVLGYAYMGLEKYEEAAIAFDKYIELAPNHPNPYDSKGEYFMKIKDYKNAYESFMKAYEIDSLNNWRLERAMNAKAIADSLEIK